MECRSAACCDESAVSTAAVLANYEPVRLRMDTRLLPLTIYHQ